MSTEKGVQLAAVESTAPTMNKTKEGIVLDRDGDVGLAAVHGSAELLEYTPAEGRQVLRRIDMFLLPFMMATYLIQFLDKSSISYAALWGMREDAHLEGNQYSWLTTIFYLGYLAGEFPINYMFQKVNITRACGILIGLWGTVLLCMAAANNFAGLMTARFFLGVLESGVSPCFVLLTAMYYKRDEQPFRTGLWFSMNGLAQFLGAPISYGIGFIHDALPAWKFPFIIYGSLTIAWSVIFYFGAAPNATKAEWLSTRQKAIAVERVAENKTGIDNKAIKWYQAREALLDLKIWILMLFAIASNIPNGGVNAFGPLIVQGFGYNALQTSLLGMPAGVTQIMALWISGLMAGYLRNCRIFIMCGGLLIAIAGVAMMYAIPSSNKVGRLLGYYMMPGFSVTWVLSLGLIQANVAGRTKKTVVNSLYFIFYCVGNLIGPQLFFASEAPHYPTGFISMLVCFGAQAGLLIILYILCRRDNFKRDQTQSSAEQLSHEALIEVGLSDMTDKENPYFRYVL